VPVVPEVGEIDFSCQGRSMKFSFSVGHAWHMRVVYKLLSGKCFVNDECTLLKLVT